MTFLPRSTPVLVLLAGALVVGASGGAVAGAMITGAQIKNGTVTSADIKNGNLGTVDLSTAAKSALQGQTGAAGPQGPQGPQGLAGNAGPAGAQGPAGPSVIPGYQIVTTTKPVAANTATNHTAACPAGKKVLGTSAFWAASNTAVQAVTAVDGLIGTGYTTGIASADTLTVRIVCATVS